jgi:hypothetical protein
VNFGLAATHRIVSGGIVLMARLGIGAISTVMCHVKPMQPTVPHFVVSFHRILLTIHIGVKTSTAILLLLVLLLLVAVVVSSIPTAASLAVSSASTLIVTTASTSASAATSTATGVLLLVLLLLLW